MLSCYCIEWFDSFIVFCFAFGQKLFDTIYTIFNCIYFYLPHCTNRMHMAIVWRNHIHSLLIVVVVLLATPKSFLLLLLLFMVLHFIIIIFIYSLFFFHKGALKLYCYIFIAHNWVIKGFLCLYDNRVTIINLFLGFCCKMTRTQEE